MDENKKIPAEGTPEEATHYHGAVLDWTNFTNANLNSVDLGGISLCSTIGNSKHIKSIFCEEYPITYTSDVIQIGCKLCAIEDLPSIEIDYNEDAIAFWSKWKWIIQQIVLASPAIPTGR